MAQVRLGLYAVALCTEDGAALAELHRLVQRFEYVKSDDRKFGSFFG
jgi:hypothetical protein